MDGAIGGFDWDDANREKCRKHGLSPEEIESVFLGSPAIDVDTDHSVSETRWRAVGRQSGGRHVFLVFTIRERDGKRLIRPISARFMHDKEVRRYAANKQVSQEIPGFPDR